MLCLCLAGPAWECSGRLVWASWRLLQPSGGNLGRLGQIVRRAGALLDRHGGPWRPSWPVLGLREVFTFSTYCIRWVLAWALLGPRGHSRPLRGRAKSRSWAPLLGLPDCCGASGAHGSPLGLPDYHDYHGAMGAPGCGGRPGGSCARPWGASWGRPGVVLAACEGAKPGRPGLESHLTRVRWEPDPKCPTLPISGPGAGRLLGPSWGPLGLSWVSPLLRPSLRHALPRRFRPPGACRPRDSGWGRLGAEDVLKQLSRGRGRELQGSRTENHRDVGGLDPSLACPISAPLAKSVAAKAPRILKDAWAGR